MQTSTPPESKGIARPVASQSLLVSARRIWLSAGALVLTVGGAFAETHHIDVLDFEFDPKILTIAPGDTVIWTARAPEHTVTSDATHAPYPNSPTIIVPIFDSSDGNGTTTMPEDATFTVTFNNVGDFPYYCRIHGTPGTFDAEAGTANAAPSMGGMPMSVGDNMVGMIRVQVPSPNDPPATPTNISPASGAIGQSTSPVLTSSAFSDPNGDHHVASQWLLRMAGSDEVLHDSGEDKINLVSAPFENLMEGSTYNFQVRYKDDRGLWSEYSTSTSFSTVSAGGGSHGLKGIYSAYNLKKNQVSKSLERTDDVIDFDWGMDRPHPSISPNNFHIVWKGNVKPQFTERYLFRVKADSGVRLKVNGETIIDDWLVTKFPIYRSGGISLQAGIPVPIELEFFDTSKEAEVSLRWSSPKTPLSVIPADRLSPP